MRIFYLLLVLPVLLLMPVPGQGGLISRVQRHYCRYRHGRCAVSTCLPREEQIGHCSTRGQKCCRTKKKI
ncbi:beta-defensin 103A-like [Manis pentadactyla]|uniref:beta-defensin 103A-like n=1 Tax=Manis pentadactyla TaxID=143292 RepID=UPI00255C4DC9|nr:beta-defensin 103A-like [Manis pentadactyla]